MQVAKLEFEKQSVLFEIRDPADNVQRTIASDHAFYEEKMLADIRYRLGPGGVVVDIGANIGNHTLFLAGICGAKVVAIEPFPASYAHLLQNIALNQLSDRVSALNLALGDRRGRGRFELPDPSQPGTAQVRSDAGAGEIEIVPLDELALPGPPDLLKIDVEDAELAVLMGAERTIRAGRPLVYVEIRTPLALRKAGNFFDSMGYRLIAVFNRTPTFLFAHRDDPRAREDADSVTADFAALVVSLTQERQQRHERAQRKQKERLKLRREKEKRKKRRSLGRSLRRLVGRLAGAGNGRADARSPGAGADRSPLQAPAVGLRAEGSHGDGLAGEGRAAPGEALARIVREGRDHLERRHRAWAATGLPFVPLPDQAALRELGEHVADGLPRVTILLPTHRPEDLPTIRRNLLCQDYPNLEVVLILNNDASDAEAMKKALADIKHLEVIQVPEHRPLGACLNEGMAQGTGDYYAKVDSDDLYGPRYISDMVLTLAGSGAALCGKRRAFHFLSHRNELFLRTSAKRGRTSAGMPGGTLFFTRDVARAVQFTTTRIAGSDVAFVHECAERGFAIADSGPFNFCRIRYPDALRHTWSTTDEKLLDNAERLCAGLRLDIINV